MTKVNMQSTLRNNSFYLFLEGLHPAGTWKQTDNHENCSPLLTMAKKKKKQKQKKKKKRKKNKKKKNTKVCPYNLKSHHALQAHYRQKNMPASRTAFFRL